MICSRCKKRPAVVFITKTDGENMENQGLCMICAKELGIKPISDMMEKMGMDEEDLELFEEQMGEMLAGVTENGEDFLPGGAATMPFLQNLFGNQPPSKQDDAASGAKKQKEAPKEKKENKKKFLNTYCTNLTQKARMQEIDRVVGREQEIYRVIQILSRRTKNNPCLIGEPGVGKTAIAEGLALRISAGDVPLRLQTKELYLLDLTALVAGTQFRGQFESRIKGLVEEVKAEGNVVLFIDEVHNLVGTGDAEGSMNAANILKPALSRGEIQVIGATTFGEYRKYIEKDPALERRFQPVTVDEPSIADTVEMLRGIKHYYEEHHRVRVNDTMLQLAAVLSERYITDRFLPDKAIDLLDEACAHASLRNKEMAKYDQVLAKLDILRKREEIEEAKTEGIDYEKIAKLKAEIMTLQSKADQLQPEALGGQVEDSDLAKVIELWTGIPAAKVKEDELSKLSVLAGKLKERIIGQDTAVDSVAAAIKRNRVQISPRRRPASFLFVGPTGVGKTELVKVLAGELFDTPETLIRLDMSEFMEKHSVSRIIGSPPGYVGYDEAGQLTEKVRRQPYSVLLFDEIEKAHPDVLNILLQILDEGMITDAHGRKVNFQNTVLIMTSNAGSEKKGGLLGFEQNENEATKEKAIEALRDFLRPEFISRVDEIVAFNKLTGQDFEQIAGLMLQEYVGTLGEKGITLRWDEQTVAYLAGKGMRGKNAARDLRTVIRSEMEDKIAALLVERPLDPPKEIQLTSDGEQLVF